MEWSLNFPLVLCIVAVSLYTYRWISRDPLKRYPGPVAAKWSNWWRLGVHFGGKQHLVYHNLHKKYGDVVRIGPDSLIFNNAASLSTIYGLNSRIEKGEFYAMAGDPEAPNLFQSPTELHHRNKRKQLVPVALSYRNVAEYLPNIRPLIDTWIHSISSKADRSKQSIDILPETCYLMVDSVLTAVYGHPAGYLENGFDIQGSLSAKASANKAAFGIPLLPWLSRVLALEPVRSRTYRKPTFDSSGHPTGINWVGTFIGKWLGTIKSDPAASPPSIVRSLINVPEDDNRKMRDPAEMFRETFNLYFAGTGSSTAAITSALYMLGKETQWQSHLREATNGVDRQQNSLWEIPTMQAFLKETWRLYPPFLSVFERTIGPGPPLSIPGAYEALPPGIKIGCSMYAVLRSPAIYGPDADEFKPERWLDGSRPEKLKAINDAWFVFGRGARACAGKELALRLICEVLAKFLDDFEAKSVDAELQVDNAFEAQYKALRMELRRY